jgi:hypothetical protein
MDVSSGIVTFEWAYQHLGLVGWPALIGIAWKASAWFSEITASAAKTVEQIDKMAVNCIPTIQKSLGTQDELLHSIDASLKTMVVSSMPARRKLKR